MPRAFIEYGVWRIPPSERIDLPAQRMATLRVSVAAALATLAIAAFNDPAPVRAPDAKAVVISQPDFAVAKSEERVPSMGQPANPLRRRPTVDAMAADEALAAASPETTATAPQRLQAAVRGAEVVDAGMIRAGDGVFRLAGIQLPETGRMCRRIDGLAVACLDRAQSYLQLLVKGRAVACERAPQSNDGPLEANCRVGDSDIAEQMVRQGWARVGEKPEERFVLAEAAARKQRLGIWRE